MKSYEGDALQRQLEQPRPQIWATGLGRVDQVIGGGLRAGDLSVVGASTGFGKSALAEQIALFVSATDDVLFMPLEMGTADTRVRLAAKLARCTVEHFERCGVDRLVQNELNSRSLHLWEPPHPYRVDELIKAATDNYSGVKFLIIDHARFIEGWVQEGPQQSSHASATRIVRYLREAARDLKMHIMLCAQVNRMGYGKRPMLSQLQDTSALEQTAAVALLLNRPGYHRGKERDILSEIIVAKNRHGPTCTVTYRWVGSTMSLWFMTDEEIADIRARQKEPVS